MRTIVVAQRTVHVANSKTAPPNEELGGQQVVRGQTSSQAEEKATLWINAAMPSSGGFGPLDFDVDKGETRVVLEGPPADQDARLRIASADDLRNRKPGA